MNDKSEKAKELIATGTEIAGAAVGSALGFLAGGPVAAAGAGILGVAISKGAYRLIADFASRHLSHREEVKIGAAAAFALAGIQKRLEKGQTPRTDGFFSDKADGRSAAEEILEGVLQKSKNEHEEKKIKLLGNFYANLAFLPEVSVGEANHLLRVAEDLTYRQMCVLAVLKVQLEANQLPLRTSDYRVPNLPLTYDMVSLLQEVFDMYTDGLIVRRHIERPGFVAMLGWSDIVPDLLILTPMGEHLAMLLGTEEPLTSNETTEEHGFPEDVRLILGYLLEPQQPENKPPETS